jgi:hypothetical protein
MSKPVKIRTARKPPIWKQKHDAYLKAVGNARLASEAVVIIQRLRYGIGLFSVGFAIWLCYIFSLGFHTVKANSSNPLSGILIVGFFVFIVMLYKALMNTIATLNWPTLRYLQNKCFNTPDWSKYLKSNERIPITEFPDPQAGRFVVATTGKEFIWRDFTDETQAGHLLVVSKPQRYGRDNLANVILHNLLADPKRPDVLAMILDSQGGMQFSPWLRYDYSEIGNNADILKALRSNVRQVEFRDYSKLPRVAVFDHDADIIGAIKWLEQEIGTRLDEATDIFGAKRAPIAVLLDEEVSKAFLEKGGHFQEITGSLSNIVFNGKPVGINLVLFAPPELEVSKLRKDFREWFDTIEYPHLTEVGATSEKDGIVKNAIPSFVDLIRVWVPQPVYGKVPCVEPEWSAGEIDKVGDQATDATLSLWDAMTAIRPWSPKKLSHEKRKMPVIHNISEKEMV